MLPVVLSTAASAAPSQPGYLVFADKIRLVNCEPAATAPCFRLKLNTLDAQGAPVSLDLPPPAQLAASTTVLVDNDPITPFYAAAERIGSQTVQGRMALILIDISGSMNKRLSKGGLTRFDAAKIAVSRFLDSFEDGVDQVAVVPFESHNVESRIRQARFATTRSGAQAEVDALPKPGPKNNTALYSSVAIGLDVLRDKLHRKAGAALPDVSLIVMTDGKNEVYKGDDPDLLDGADGLDAVAAKVQDSGIQVIGVGFGDPAEIDVTALRRLSTSNYMAPDAGTLNNVFAFARKLLNNRIAVTFSSPWPDRASLSGRTLHIAARLKLASGETLNSNTQTWTTPEMGIPAFDQKCDTAEMKALLLKDAGRDGGDLESIVRPILVFVGLGALILILWFWMPRLLWPERYMGIVPSGQRWAASSGTKWGRNAPTGFGKTASKSAPRTPADPTVVQPRTEFTKTRLDRHV